MNINKFVFVAVVYNNYNDTFDLCCSIHKMEHSDCATSCVLIDNSDKVDIRKHIDSLAEEFEFVSILRPTRNLGYFGAFNFFFDSFLHESDSVIVLCNNDLVFDKGFCKVYLRKKYNEDVFVVCPDVITFDGIHQNPHVLKPRGWLARAKLDLYFSHYYVAYILKQIQRAVKAVAFRFKRVDTLNACYIHMGIGACYVLLPRFLKKFSKLYFPHFLYGEEAYLTKQVHSAGGKLYFDPDLRVLHKESATLSKLPSRVTYEFGREGYWEYRSFY